jgi:hypothetical protein
MTVHLPQMFRLRQHFETTSLRDPAAAVTAQLAAAPLRDRIAPGETVAIAVGSRGITDIASIVAAVVRHVFQLGAAPFLVPAMGSHGGGTAEGQRDTLLRLGIDPQQLQCPIRSSMQTRRLGETADGIPVHFDEHALAADHLIVVNRIKPHTRFAGKYQSGLLKMLMIGLGKREGASIYHRGSHSIPFDRLIETVAPLIFRQRPVTLGVAILENALEQTAAIHLLAQEELLGREPELQREAQRQLAKLPFAECDLLIVDRIGKEISGTGMDTNVIGRKQSDKRAGPDEYPKVRQIYVRGLTAASHGNAAGIGLAEYCHARVLDQIDYDATRVNALTADHITAAAVPAHFPSDRTALEAAATQAGMRSGSQLRWLWIRDTLQLSEVLCSEALRGEAERRDDLQVLGPPSPLQFDAAGELIEPWDNRQ